MGVLDKLKKNDGVETNAEVLCDNCGHPIDFDQENGVWYHLMRDTNNRCIVKGKDGSSCGCEFANKEDPTPVDESVPMANEIIEDVKEETKIPVSDEKVDSVSKKSFSKDKVPDMILGLLDGADMSVSEAVMSLEVVKHYLIHSMNKEEE